MKAIMTSLFSEGREHRAHFNVAQYDDSNEAIRAASRISITIPRSISAVIDEHGEMSLILAPIPIEPVRRAIVAEAGADGR